MTASYPPAHLRLSFLLSADRRYGLEHAMVAHFCADIVFHVIVGG